MTCLTLKPGAAQTHTIMRWRFYLQQRCVHSTSPLLQDLQTLSGPVTFVSEGDAEKALERESIGPLPAKAGMVPVPTEAWCTDGPANGSPLTGMLRSGLSSADSVGTNPAG